MNPTEQFKQECASEIKAQGDNLPLQQLTRSWMDTANSGKYSYHFEWLGRPIIQYPQDIVAMQELIWQIKPEVAELKRFFIYPDAATTKNSRMMLDVAIDWARQSGFRKIRLDPADTMPGAVKLYRQEGFFELQYASNNPQVAAQRFFEFSLESVPDFYKSRGYNFAGKSRLNALLG